MEEIEDDNDIPSSSHGKYISAAEIKSMWNLIKISANLGTPEQCVKFAEGNGLILRSKLCGAAKALAEIKVDFQELREPVRLENFVGDSVLSSETITDWYNFCREAVVCYQIDKQEAIGKIGGPGKKVQIDEIKFAVIV